jgi:hypothetical protein
LQQVLNGPGNISPKKKPIKKIVTGAINNLHPFVRVLSNQSKMQVHCRCIPLKKYLL